MAQWDKLGSRGRVDDRRGQAMKHIGGISLTGVLLILAVNYLAGGEVTDVVPQIIEQASQGAPTQQVDNSEFAGMDDYEVFASTVLGSNNDMWREIFARNNRTYNEPTLVLFREATRSGCGIASSQHGPHYCPLDETIYLDETFFDELTKRFGARGGDVAEAYVIAHEVAHHAQNELGIMDKMREDQARFPDRANEFSVNTELQADCFAGLWGHSIKGADVLEPNEIREAMDAAAAVGDDRIQEKVTGRVNPEAFTHGSSEQRLNAFMTGYNTGSLQACL